MAYNTRSIKKDVDGRPVPQYFNSMTDDYEPLLGENGAARSVLYGPNGQPINSSNPLPTKDDALAALLGELNNAPVTDPSATSATVLQLLRGLLAVAGRETTLAAVKAAIDELTARAATEETLSATRDALDSLAQRGLATEVTLAQAAQALATLAGTVDAGAQQVTLSGSEVERAKLTTPITVSPGSTVTALQDIPVRGSKIFVNVKTPTSEPEHTFSIQILHRWAEVAGTPWTIKSETHIFQNSRVGAVGPIDVMTPHVSVRITNADNEAHQYVVYLGAHT